ncbi:hypothetical protein DFH09DRAFT_1310004 [Mycena vulgaris]|nr:hypothetical protein DFH09DRAFT_1310004 [Mycena vulgaris]
MHSAAWELYTMDARNCGLSMHPVQFGSVIRGSERMEASWRVLEVRLPNGGPCCRAAIKLGSRGRFYLAGWDPCRIAFLHLESAHMQPDYEAGQGLGSTLRMVHRHRA